MDSATPALLASLAIVSSAVAGLIWVIKRMFNDILPALKSLTKATEQNTSATKSADDYLKLRNGRDIEKHEELLKATREIPKTMQRIADAQKEAILNAVEIREQYVQEQCVEHQTVKSQT